MGRPGRLFNRAPSMVLNNPEQFRNRNRKGNTLRPVSSYHDLYDIPTMSAHPDAKGSGGAGKLGSPRSVKDVKCISTASFDPTSIAYHEEIGDVDSIGDGGVPIDLCLPEYNIDSDEDEDDRLEQQQQHQQQQQHLQQQQLQQQQLQQLKHQQHQQQHHFESCRRQQRIARPLSLQPVLAPIFEDRKVTFAAQHVVAKVDDDLDSCAIDPRFVHQVFDAVTVRFIPHYTEYDDDVRDSLWYTPSEFAAMKARAIEAKKIEWSKLLHKRSQETKSSTRTKLKRMMQADLETCSLFPSPFHTYTPPPPVSQNNIHEEENCACNDAVSTILITPAERRFRQEAMVDAVLLEQYEQRVLCLRVYGRVDEGFTGILDSDRLARVCAFAGDTQRSQERAVANATKALCGVDDDNEDEDSSDTSSVTAIPPEDRHASASAVAAAAAASSALPLSVRGSKRSPSFLNSSAAITVETSHVLDKSIGLIFRALLSPFLEIRRGDLFLGIGEEMSVTTL